MRELLRSLARWPLLLGAVVCYAGAVYLLVTDNSQAERPDVRMAEGLLGIVGSVCLGAWIFSLAAEDND